MATTVTDTIAGLRAARSLIEKGWTQGVYARNARGQSVGPEAIAAVCWCVEGSCLAVSGGRDATHLFDALMAVIRAPSLPVWNDDRRRTQRTAIRMVDRAIARLEAEASV